MKKLAFIAWWEWFNHTKSADFLVEVLKKEFEVKKISRPNWTMKDNAPVEELNKEKFDTILFFYALPPARYLAKLKCKNIVWVPMYDGTKGLRLAKLKFLVYKLFNLKVICFSKKMYHELKPFFNCEYYQYFPKPKKRVKFDKNRLFFWERRDDLDWTFTKKIVDQADFNKITIKQNKDGLAKRSKKIKETNKIKIVDKWLTDKKYEQILNSHNVFVAPRLKEGIGFSFLHALSRGYVVIANNESTMNEYIKNGETGFLFNFKKPKKICISKQKLKTISNNTYTFMKTGYTKWQKEQNALIKWISK